MKVTAEMIEKVKEMAADPYREYEYIGIRVHEVPFELGEMTHRSHIWDDGNDTGVELDGVSVLLGAYADLAKQYYGDYVAIVAGNCGEYGEDKGEIVISDATVIEILA